MPTQDLTLRMRARGAAATRRDVDSVGREVDRTGKRTRRASDDVGIFSRALTIMRTRAVIAAAVVAGVGAATAVAVPSILLLSAAALALGAIFAPAMALGVGAFQLFSAQANVAGTSANALKDALAALKHAWRVAVSPGAAEIMRGVAAALAMLSPLLADLRDPLTYFGHVMATVMTSVAAGMVGLGPGLKTLIYLVAGLAAQLAVGAVPMLQALLAAAIAGVPVAHQLIDWLIAFVDLLPGAVAWMERFAHSGTAINTVHDVFKIVGDVAVWVASVVADLAGIAYQLYVALLPVERILAGALLAALQTLAGALDYANTNFHAVKGILVPLTLAVLAYVTAVKAAEGATWLWTTATTVAKNLMLVVKGIGWVIWWGQMARAIGLAGTAMLAFESSAGKTAAGAAALKLAQWAKWWFQLAKAEGIAATAMLLFDAAAAANPIGLIIVGVVALAAAFALAYAKVGWFRDGVNAVWDWIKGHWPMLVGILAGPFGVAVAFIVTHIDQIKGALSGIWDGLKSGLQDAVNWVISKLNFLIDQWNKVPFHKDVGHITPLGQDAANQATPTSGPTPLPTTAAQNRAHAARGGVIERGGAVEVGERGRETLEIPAASVVRPHGWDEQPVVVHATLVLEDGTVLARTTARAARKRKSTR